MSNLTYVQADLADGTIDHITGLTTIEGVPGWTLDVYPDNTVWAYAPMHYALFWGEIARQIA